MPRARSFTLIEVLIAIALTMVLVGTMFGFLLDLLASRARVMEHVHQQDAVAALMRQLDADLTTCVVGDRTVGSGVRGDAESLRVLSRGVAGGLASRGSADPQPFSDLQFTQYGFDYENTSIQMTRGSASPGASAAAGRQDSLDGPIYRLRFRYHNGTEWSDSFDSMQSGRLPGAVEVSIWLVPPPDQLEQPEAFADRQVTADRPPDSDRTSAASAATEPVAVAAAPADVPAQRVRVFLVPDAADTGSTGTVASPGGES